MTYAPSPRHEAAVAAQRRAAMTPAPTAGGVSGARLAEGLMLDAKGQAAWAEALDQWLASGGALPLVPPVALPPPMARALAARLGEVLADRRAMAEAAASRQPTGAWGSVQPLARSRQRSAEGAPPPSARLYRAALTRLGRRPGL